MTNGMKKARPLVPVVVVNNDSGARKRVYALQDGGSDRDIITPRLVEELELTTGWETSTIATFDEVSTKRRKNANFTIESIDGEYACEVEEALVGSMPMTVNDIPPAKRTDLGEFSHIEDIEFVDLDAEVELVIGIAHVDTYYGKEWRLGKTNEPMAINTVFGWTVAGIIGKADNNEATVAFMSTEKRDLKQKLDDILQADFGVGKKAMSKEQCDAQRQLDESVFFDVDKGMYGCALPFRGGREEAIKKMNSYNSRGMAAKRLESLRRKLEKNPELKKKVFAEVDKYMAQGKMEVVEDDDNDDANAKDPRWVVPLHFVLQGEKLRLIHDCRACVDGFCINDVLLGIMDYLTPMKRPLRNFRKYRYVMTYDIVGFFYRVLLHNWDRNAFRCYFFADETMKQKILIRTMNQPFGGSSSPNICGFILRYHAEKMRPEFGDRIADAIRDDYYVDDGNGGDDDEEAYRKFKIGMTEAMRRGGFELDKWAFSHPLLVGEPEPPEGKEVVKVLGFNWNTKKDTISIRINEDDFGEVKTMRQLVSVGHKIFDPEGMIIPDGVDIRKGIQIGMLNPDWGWDKLLDKKSIDKYENWRARRKEMAMIEMPRAWNNEQTVGITPDLHIFGDANPEKYGAVAYRRVVGRDGVVAVSFVCARGHVVPTIKPRKRMKKQKNEEENETENNGEMPRLELVAARKTLDISKEATELAVEEYGKIIHWSDSTTVLKWVFKPWEVKNDFVGNRVRKIQQETVPEQWYYVPGDVNPADVITKGFPPGKPEKISEFHQGPEFLRRPEEEWPEMIVERFPKRPDAFVVCATATQQPPPPPLPTAAEGVLWLTEMKGSWFKKKMLVATMTWVKRRWLPGGRGQRELVKGKTRVNHADVREAEMTVIKAIQEKAFGKEKKELVAKNVRTPVARAEITKKSRIGRMSPFVDADGLIRVGSRLVHADVSNDQKFPILLPDDSTDVRSLIRCIHVGELHGGQGHTHNALRRRFWVLKGPVTVKKVVRRCLDCQKATKAPEKQKMAPLPVERLDGDHAWKVTGVDMVGPFDVRKTGSRATHKQYIALFTCFSSRAIHLEVVDKMDSDSFINALMRFCARRPGLHKLVSDNGTNFVGAKNIIQKETNQVKEIDKETRREIQELSAKCTNNDRKVSSKALFEISEKARPELLEKGLEWEFLPPYASHYAGVWERLVGLVKKHLAKVVPSEIIHHDTFFTLVVEIEGTLNRRPLTAISTDPRDNTALTPEMLIAAGSAGVVTADVAPETPMSEGDKLRYRFKRARSYVDAFWKRWRGEYINQLANRQKWTKTKTNLAVGDVVMIVDQSVKRKKWQLGRIVDVDHAQEHVRKVDIRRADGSVITRDRTGVVKLEYDEDG